MPHVVTANCTDCRFTDCVTVCPVSCFHGDENRIYIDPTTCVDCGACIPICPVSAIKEDLDLTEDEQVFIDLNARRATETPVIRLKQPPLSGAETRRTAKGLR